MNQIPPDYKIAIGDLITSYNSLTELRIFFRNYCTKCYNNECNKYHIVDDQGFWPHKELLTWLMAHPYQITKLRYPFDLFTIGRGDYDWITALDIERSLPVHQKIQLLSQRHNYLNYLTELQLEVEKFSKYTHNYLFYKYINRNETSPYSLLRNLRKLVVQHSGIYHWNCQENKFKFNIYHWLILFPSLNTLEVTDLWLQHDCELILSNSGLLQQQQQPQQITLTTAKRIVCYIYPCFQLNKLIIARCRICFDISEMTDLLKSLIHLKSFYMEDVWFTAEPGTNSFILYAPHLKLSYLQLIKLHYDQYTLLNSNGGLGTASKCSTYYIRNIRVKEISSNLNIIKNVKLPNEKNSSSHIWFDFICHSVDNLFT